MKTIVVGYDETPAAERALERAATLAKAFGATVIAASVAPVLHVAGRGIGPIDPADPPERHREQLTRAAARLDGLGVPYELVDGVGDPPRALADLAHARRADLIVVGTREPSLLARLLGQSVSESVSHHAHCDVMIVH